MFAANLILWLVGGAYSLGVCDYVSVFAATEESQASNGQERRRPNCHRGEICVTLSVKFQRQWRTRRVS